MYWLLLLLLLVPTAHGLLLRLIPYRWVVNSITYPINKHIISRKYSRMTHEQRIEKWVRFEIMDHWAKPYWFSRAISKYILLKYLGKGGK